MKHRLWTGVVVAVLCASSIQTSQALSTNLVFANDDVFVHSDNLTFTNAYDGYVLSSQVVFGLAAANGVATGARRSYMEFTVGDTTAASVTLMLYNYWGANMGGGGNPAAAGTLRFRATPVGTPLTFSEPGVTLDTSYVSPAETAFTSTILTTATGAITTPGWYEFDLTSWYNARLGETTTILMRGAQVSGNDFPIFEDRENSAFLNGSANTIAGAGPRLLVVIPEPSSATLLTLGALLLCARRRLR